MEEAAELSYHLGGGSGVLYIPSYVLLVGRWRRLGADLLARSSPPWAMLLEIHSVISSPAGCFLGWGKRRSGGSLRLVCYKITSDPERVCGNYLDLDSDVRSKGLQLEAAGSDTQAVWNGGKQRVSLLQSAVDALKKKSDLKVW